ncbi:MAG: hypothetical protein EOO45_16520, partial [Flavobacterium sp.]
MKKTFLLFVMITATLSSFAKIWRINNNAGITADFSTVFAAATSPTVLAGDTIHLEPSSITYQTNSIILTKRLVFIGPGFFLDPASASTPGNAGLQATTEDSEISFMRLGPGSDGTRFLGVSIVGSLYMNGSSNVSFEKVYFPTGVYYESGTNDGHTYRKCFFNNSANIGTSGTAVITNFICENNIFYNNSYVTLPTLSGSGNIFRNNSISGGNGMTLSNIYIANNIFGTSASIFVNCTIKNNLFQANQTLPGTATNNQLNVNIANVYVGGTTGSFDSRMALKAGSPAIAAGLTIGAIVTPD